LDPSFARVLQGIYAELRSACYIEYGNIEYGNIEYGNIEYGNIEDR
jgi:hypothetical protein